MTEHEVAEMVAEPDKNLTPDQFFAPWDDKHLHWIADRVADAECDLELDQDWSTVDAVMLAFSYLIRDGRLEVGPPSKTTPVGGGSNGK